jgi:AraC-like DNA-binding protein
MTVQIDEVLCSRSAGHAGAEETSSVPTLVLPRRGVFCYHVDRDAVIADANTALLFHPDRPYRVSHPIDGGDDCLALRFDDEVVIEALGRRATSAAAWFLPGPLQRYVAAVAGAALVAREPLEREERALDVLAALTSAPGVHADVRDAGRIDAVRQRLAASVGAPIALKALARDVGCSPFHLARRFRAHTGTSLHQYHLSLRFAVARALLREGADDLTDVALRTGFASHGHFTTAFHAAHGTTPSAWRSRVSVLHRKTIEIAWPTGRTRNARANSTNTIHGAHRPASPPCAAKYDNSA